MNKNLLLLVALLLAQPVFGATAAFHTGGPQAHHQVPVMPTTNNLTDRIDFLRVMLRPQNRFTYAWYIRDNRATIQAEIAKLIENNNSTICAQGIELQGLFDAALTEIKQQENALKAYKPTQQYQQTSRRTTTTSTNAQKNTQHTTANSTATNTLPVVNMAAWNDFFTLIETYVLGALLDQNGIFTPGAQYLLNNRKIILQDLDKAVLIPALKERSNHLQENVKQVLQLLDKEAPRQARRIKYSLQHLQQQANKPAAQQTTQTSQQNIPDDSDRLFNDLNGLNNPQDATPASNASDANHYNNNDSVSGLDIDAYSASKPYNNSQTVPKYDFFGDVCKTFAQVKEMIKPSAASSSEDLIATINLFHTAIDTLLECDNNTAFTQRKQIVLWLNTIANIPYARLSFKDGEVLQSRNAELLQLFSSYDDEDNQVHSQKAPRSKAPAKNVSASAQQRHNNNNEEQTSFLQRYAWELGASVLGLGVIGFLIAGLKKK